MARKKVTVHDDWWCMTCDKDKLMSRSEIIEHLRTVHHCPDTKGESKMILHMDARDYFSSTYEHTIHGVVVQNYQCAPRPKNDLMRFA